MDPLSDVLSLLRPRSCMSAGFDAGGAWSVRFPDQQGTIKCGALVSGRCWLVVEDGGDPVLLEPGDSFLLPRGLPFRLASDPALPATDAGRVLPPAREGGVVTINGGGDVFLVSSRFAIDGDHAGVLVRMLPPIVHLRDAPATAALRWSVERMMEELGTRRPGTALVLRHLAHIVLLQALRARVADGTAGGVGWLFALGDRQIGAAIARMHEEPARRWTVQALAAGVGMSRSAFAARFRETVGMPPLDYLTRWRMAVAGDRLTTSAEPLAVIAESLGYASESAFGNAFRKVMGCPPRQYGRTRTAQNGAAGPAAVTASAPAPRGPGRPAAARP